MESSGNREPDQPDAGTGEIPAVPPFYTSKQGGVLVTPRLEVGGLIVLAVMVLAVLWIGGESHYQSCIARAVVDKKNPDSCSVLPWSSPDSAGRR